MEQPSSNVDNFPYTNAFVSFALNFAVKAVAEPGHTEDTEPEGEQAILTMS